MSYRVAMEYFIVQTGFAGLRTFCLVLLYLAKYNQSTTTQLFFFVFVKHCLAYIVLLLPSSDRALAPLNQSPFSQCVLVNLLGEQGNCVCFLVLLGILTSVSQCVLLSLLLKEACILHSAWFWPYRHCSMNRWDPP